MQRKYSLEDHLSCAICLHRFFEPKNLPNCSHTYCKGCIAEVVGRNNRSISCPTCRAVSVLPPTGVDGLQTNFVLQGILEALRDTPPEPKSPLGKCVDHPKKNVKFFCFNSGCTQYICKDCAVSTHKQHNFEPISNLAQHKREEIVEQVRLANETITDLENRESFFAAIHEQMSFDCNATVSGITRYWEAVRTAISQKESSLIEGVQTETRRKQEYLRQKRSEVLMELDRLQQAVRMAEHLHNASDTEILANSPQIPSTLCSTIDLCELRLAFSSAPSPALQDLSGSSHGKIAQLVDSLDGVVSETVRPTHQHYGTFHSSTVDRPVPEVKVSARYRSLERKHPKVERASRYGAVPEQGSMSQQSSNLPEANEWWN